jgi:integrase
VDAFREYLIVIGLASKSVRLYHREALRAEAWFVEQGGSIDTAVPSVIATYCDRFPRTCSSRKMLRSTFKHYWTHSGRPDPPLGAIRVPPRRRMVCRAVEEDDARILAKAARAEGGPAGLATCLALFMALRRTEIAELRWDCFDDGWLTLTGKGDVTDAIPVHSVVAELLVHHNQVSPWLFPGRFGGPVTPATIWHWIRTLADDAGVVGFTPHRGRHTALATANDATGDLRAVQAFARHAKPETTAGYTRATNRRLRAVVESIDY